MANVPDLTKQPPRSPRVRLGGYVILPRMLDKGRATIAGKNGEYHYACPMDQRLLEWINTNSTTKPRQADILAWSAMQEQRVPTDPESRAYFNELHSKTAQHREDIATWFDLLDLDDYVSFGGNA